jgi:hypothetical protein
VTISCGPNCLGTKGGVCTGGKKAISRGPNCLRTRTNGPPRGLGHVLRLEDLWSRFVTQTGTKVSFGIKFVFAFLECLYFQNFSIFFISLISNHLYSHVKLQTYGSHSILISNYILVVLTSRSVTHPHTAPPLARLTSLFLP